MPSFMGQKGCKGMHGYHPDEADTSSAILSNKALPDNLESIEQIFWLMVNELNLIIENHLHRSIFVES